MAENKKIILHNQSRKPDNILKKELEIKSLCEELERELPRFMSGFFAYLRGNVLPMTRLAYLRDIRFFCNYLINETDLVSCESTREIKERDFDRIQGVDINMFLDFCRSYKVEKEKSVHIYEIKGPFRKEIFPCPCLFSILYREGL